MLLFDGAMGSMLQQAGMPAGAVPEEYNIGDPALIERIHREYLRAGADILTTNTFGCNALKMKDSRYAAQDMIRAALGCARRAVEAEGKRAYIALDIGPIGQLMEPMGTLKFEEAYALFRDMIVCAKDMADVILFETMSDLYEVKAGVLEDECRWMNRGFIRRMTHGRPWVTLKIAASLDGKIALENGESKWITGPESRSMVHAMRAESDAVLTGIGTVLADDPQMNVRLEGDYPSPVKYVVDRWAQTPVNAKILQGRRCVIFVGKAADPIKIAALEKAGAEVRVIEDAQEGLDLKAVIASIGADAVNELHVEAGAGLNGALLAAGLIDEIVCFCAPCLMGEGLPIARLPQCLKMDEVQRWRFHDVCRVGEDLQLTLRKK